MQYLALYSTQEFAKAADQIREILTASQDADTIEQRLYQTEKWNLEHFGYGVKSFTQCHP